MAVKIIKYYQKYLRANSYRNALVYQKRYLLLLIGGFKVIRIVQAPQLVRRLFLPDLSVIIKFVSEEEGETKPFNNF